MSAYLLTWNPRRWDWHYLHQSIQTVKQNGFCLERWSCGVTKKIVVGDRVYLMRLGVDPRGIMAAGRVVREPFEAEHWDPAKRAKGIPALFIMAEFETILDPQRAIFHVGRLADAAYAGMNWTPQGSGVTIPDTIAAQLEKDWNAFVSAVDR